ncbi:MAG: hypothetical protein ACK5N7_06590 [Curvibacter sp.]|jgi:hypothetical protein|nr:hypothetical protein [Curvibacter sp.]
MTTPSLPTNPTAAPAPTRPKAAPKKAAGKTAAKAPKAPKTSMPAPGNSARKDAAPKKASKPAKVKKPKLVRDSYTMPKDEHAVLAKLKLRSAELGQAVKKSELLRAGLKALAAQNDKALLAALKAVPSLKTGRPKKDREKP